MNGALCSGPTTRSRLVKYARVQLRPSRPALNPNTLLDVQLCSPYYFSEAQLHLEVRHSCFRVHSFKSHLGFRYLRG